MADVVQFLIYPAIANDYSFPAEVRQAIANAPELTSKFANKAATQTALDTLTDKTNGVATNMDGGTP